MCAVSFSITKLCPFLRDVHTKGLLEIQMGQALSVYTVQKIHTNISRHSLDQRGFIVDEAVQWN